MTRHKLWLFSALLALVSGPAPAAGPANPVAPYPPPEEMIAEIYGLATAHPDRARVIEYGRSVQGRPLLVVRISRPGSGPQPAGWVGGAIHGNEWIGNRMAMAVAHLLLDQDGSDPMVSGALDEMDFYITPCVNPDGYFNTWEDPKEPDPGSCRKNAHGVDLNRNWPMPGRPTLPIDWAGSPDPASGHYRGPAPLSEPETSALDRFFREHAEIVAAIEWHSYAAVQYPAHCPSTACTRRFKKMCRAFSLNQPKLKYPRLQSRVFDSYTGEMEDWLYAEYGVLAMDVEIGRRAMNQKACGCDDIFWTFNPKDPEWWVENDARAGIAALQQAVRTIGGRRVAREER
ncbi:MAG TPA: M14 family metallopeptidase [bacterium]|nr:M14 family metallopeptidase [bacterium]